MGRLVAEALSVMKRWQLVLLLLGIALVALTLIPREKGTWLWDVRGAFPTRDEMLQLNER